MEAWADVCTECKKALTAQSEENQLIKTKTKGGLIFPSESVQAICHYTEKVFRASVSGPGNSYEKLPYDVNYDSIVSEVVNHCTYGEQLFSGLSDHIEKFHSKERINQKEFLIMTILGQYLKVRFHYAAKIFTGRHKRKNKVSRQQSTKVMLFSGQ